MDIRVLLKPFYFAAALTLIVTALVATGCSSDETAEEVDTTTDLIDEADPTPVFDHTETPRLAGVSTEARAIEPGDCFNHYVYRDAAEFLQQVTAVIDCDVPHHREAYYKTDYPSPKGEPYPREEILKQWAIERCLDKFEDFVGKEYVLSLLELGVTVPEFTHWVEEDDRSVICFVFPDKGGRLTASVKGSGI